MNGALIGSGGVSLFLFPGSTAKVKIFNSAILGVWVREKKEWKLILDDDQKVAESNEGNNEIKVETLCWSWLNKKMKKKLPKIQ